MPVPELEPVVLGDRQYFVHPTAEISPDASVGNGARIYGGVVIGAGALLGAETVVYAGTRIGDYCDIGDSVFIDENVVIAGSVRMKTGAKVEDIADEEVRALRPASIEIDFGAEIGSNATVRCGRTVRQTRVGAFAVVTSSTIVYQRLRPFGLYDGTDQVGWVDPFGKIISRRPNVVPPYVLLADELPATLTADKALTPERRVEFTREVEAAYQQLR